ncbi:MAG: alpha/beta hydrolase [Bryobacteraceae bacterium]
MKHILPIAALLALGVAPSLSWAAERGEEIRLWPNGAPGSEGIAAPEVSKPSANPKYAKWPGNFTLTHYPSIYVFLPPKEKATGAAMIVAPGGGHSQLVIDKEGWEVADWLNDRGIAAFVLKYRLFRVPGSKYTLGKEVYEDAARSMRLVRSRAKEFGIDANRIGFIGFSAGGEVAGMIETKFDAGDPSAADPIERVTSRPDFNVLIYPFYRPGSVPFRPLPPGNGSPGNGTPPALLPIAANEQFPIPDNAPPVFMVCATDDPSHVVPTVKFYLELEANHIPAEMHIYDSGGHGFGLRPTKKPGSPVESWPARLSDWLAAREISKPVG